MFRDESWGLPRLPVPNSARFYLPLFGVLALLLLPVVSHAGAVLARLPDAPTVRPPRDLYVLAIGINEYRAPIQRLDAAKEDAVALAGVLAERAKKQFRAVFPVTLTDAAATRGGIEKAFQQVISSAGPEDVFLFAFAGHAVPKTAGADRFVLLPADARDWKPERPEPTDIPVSLVQRWSDQVQARRQVLILDSNGESDLFDAFAARFAAEPVEARRLSNRSVVLFGNVGNARELPELKHGLLSYALMEGLKGEADSGRPGDGVVTARELEGFLYPKTARLSKGRQEFRSFACGGDFPLTGAPAHAGPDREEPKLHIHTPALSRDTVSVVDEADLEVAGVATDDGEVREVRVQGKSAKLAPSGDFSAVVSLDLGETEIVVEALDATGKVGGTSFFVNRREAGAPPVVVQARFGKDYALLFATDEYREWTPNLRNPILDARTIARELRERYGFQPPPTVGLPPDLAQSIQQDMTVENPSKRQILDLLLHLQKPGTFKEADDQLFLFFAGHGTFRKDMAHEGFLIPHDARKDDPHLEQCLSFTTLAGYINNIRDCKHILVVVDACYGGTFRNAEDFAGRPNPPGSAACAPDPAGGEVREAPKPARAPTREQIIQMELSREGRYFLTSGGKERVSDGEPGKHSPFARSLLTVLQGGGDKRLLSYEDLVYKVRKTIQKEAPDQKPHYGAFPKVKGTPYEGFLFVQR